MSRLACLAFLLSACGSVGSEAPDAPASTTLRELSVAASSLGTVTSVPAGIACGSECAAAFPEGTTVTLTARPSTNASFLGWGVPECSDHAPCTLTLASDRALAPTFDIAADRKLLSIAPAGGGEGVVTSTPSGIRCGTDCDELFLAGTRVTLDATAKQDSTFMGWIGGGCTGTSACTVSVEEALSVLASFERNPRLTVGRIGTGAGTVTSSVAGIDCGEDCAEAYPPGTIVTLTATPARGSYFGGWSGSNCIGLDTCTVTLDDSRPVLALFNLEQHSLTVVRNGTGEGTVTGPAIDCGTDCSELLDFGTTVTLTAVPAPGNVFAGWTGGGCSGIGTCTTNVTQATVVMASFQSRCDSFDRADTTMPPGWTERAGDWVISAGRLRDNFGALGTVYSHHITRDAIIATDACVRFDAVYSGPNTFAAAGAVMRWTSANNYLVALVQDNYSRGDFNAIYIQHQQYPNSIDIGGGATYGSFGTNPRVEVCTSDTSISIRVDANHDGIYEAVKTATTNHTAQGLMGLMTATASAAADNYCAN